MRKITIRKIKPTAEDGVCTYQVIALKDEFDDYGETAYIEVERIDIGFRWTITQAGRNRNGVCEDVNDIVPGLTSITRMPDDDRYVILFVSSFYSPRAVFNQYFPKECFELEVVS